MTEKARLKAAAAIRRRQHRLQPGTTPPSMASLLTMGAVVSWNTPPPRPRLRAQLRPIRSCTDTEIERCFGVCSINLKVVRGTVELHLEVLDPVRAEALFQPENMPVVIEEESGIILRLRQLPGPDALCGDQLCCLYYQDVRGMVQPGCLVSLQIGDRRLEHLVVR